MINSVYVAQSQIDGNNLGVFTKKPIKKHELILIFHGNLIMEDSYYGYTNNCERWLQIGDKKWLDPIDNLCRAINHSCNPNAAFFNLVELKAIRSINPLEEIVFDYDTTDWIADPLFICKCEDKNCRQLVQGYKFLPDELRLFYKERGIIPDFLLRLEDNESN